MIRRFVACALVLGAVLGFAACGDDDNGGDASAREAAIYAAILGSVAAASAKAEETPVVYVAPLGNEKAIPLDIQVSVVDTIGDDAVVRFVDKAEQAIDVDADGAPVFDDGVLVHLGTVPPTGTTVVVPGEIYRDAANTSVLEFEVTEQGDLWVVTGAGAPAGATATTAS